jgi:hypothetical protein
MRETVERPAPAHISVYVTEEIVARGWSYLEFVEKMAHGVRGGEYVDPKMALCCEFLFNVREPNMMIGAVADRLAEVFGTSAEVWTNIDNAWRAANGGCDGPPSPESEVRDA